MSGPRAHRRPVDVVLDVDDDALAAALASAWSPHRVHRVTPETGPAATAAVVDLDATVVVCAPSTPAGDADAVARLALRARWWSVAAPVVGARVVLVSTAEVFDAAPATGGDREADGKPGTEPDGVTDGVEPGPRPDEFTVPAPTSSVGRARRAAEVEVAATRPSGVVVRHGPDAVPAELAATVRWAALVPGPGPWHHPGTVLDHRHTLLVRRDTTAGEPVTVDDPDEVEVEGEAGDAT